MGSCSNRPENQNEKISRFTKEISRARDTEEAIRNGAEIRGTLGIEKGNKFIKAIQDLSK